MSKAYWQHKSAVICGGSTGLGREIARQLAVAGVRKLLLLARDDQKLTLVTNELASQFPVTDFDFLVADLTQHAELQSRIPEIVRRIGTIDLVVQAVGASDRGTLNELTEERLDFLLAANLHSSLNCLQCFQSGLRSECSHVLLIGSLASLFAPRYLGGYAVAKHALAALAQQARLEMASQGVHVTLACPGPIKRQDAGARYDSLASDNLPQEALRPGGGAALNGLDPAKAARVFLRAASRRKPLVIRPRSAHLLWTLSTLSPRLGDWILRRKTS